MKQKKSDVTIEFSYFPFRDQIGDLSYNMHIL